MPISNPNRRCVCGFTRFREVRQSVEQSVGRWMLFDTTALGGFGATPLGTFFGAGSGGTWGKFTGTFRATTLSVVCENCSRVRLQKRLGGIAPFGAFIEENRVIVVASDALRPMTCYSLRVTSPEGEELEVPLSFIPGAPPPIAAPTPTETAATPPPGEPTVDTMLMAILPELPTSGSYLLTLVDRCCGCETALATVTLEAPPMIFTPLDADIGGAPTRWLQGSRLTLDAGQPAGSTRQSIPFDKCKVVVDYDSRDGQLPSDQGWTRVGSGPASNWALVEGGALRLQTTSPNTNYFEKAVTVSPAPTKIYAYASMLSEDIPAGAIGSGLNLTALYGANGFAYDGVRVNVRENQVFYTDLAGGSDTQIFPSEVPSQWIGAGAADRQSAEEIGYEGAVLHNVALMFTAPVFGTTGLAAADEVRVRFGNVVGAPSLLGFFRDVVAADGRFIRARFTGFTQVSTPRLRLYVAADANGSASKTARFLVKYGLGTAVPSAPPPYTASATVNLILPNTVYEVPIDLPNLSANQPIWFSIERDWDHADDALDATVHLFQATLRTQ